MNKVSYMLIGIGMGFVYFSQDASFVITGLGLFIEIFFEIMGSDLK